MNDMTFSHPYFKGMALSVVGMARLDVDVHHCLVYTQVMCLYDYGDFLVPIIIQTTGSAGRVSWQCVLFICWVYSNLIRTIATIICNVIGLVRRSEANTGIELNSILASCNV